MNKFAVACTLAVAASAQEIRIEPELSTIGKIAAVAASAQEIRIEGELSQIEQIAGHVEEAFELRRERNGAIIERAEDTADAVDGYIRETIDTIEWIVEDTVEAVHDYKEDPESFDFQDYKENILEVAEQFPENLEYLKQATEEANSTLVEDLKEIAEERKDLEERARSDIANFATEHIFIDGVSIKEAFPESQAWFLAHFNPKATTVSQMFAVPQFGQKLQYVPESSEWAYVDEQPVYYYDYEQDQWVVYEPEEELSYDEWTAEGDEYYGSLEEFTAPARFEVRFDLAELRAWAESRDEIYRDLRERFHAAVEEHLAARELADQEFARTIEEYFQEGKAADEETLQWAVDYVFDNVSLDGTPLSANGTPTIELAQVKASSSFSYGYLAFGGIAVAGAAVFMANKKTTKQSFDESLLV